MGPSSGNMRRDQSNLRARPSSQMALPVCIRQLWSIVIGFQSFKKQVQWLAQAGVSLSGPATHLHSCTKCMTIAVDGLVRAQLLFTRNPSSPRSSKFSFERLLLPPRPALPWSELKTPSRPRVPRAKTAWPLTLMRGRHTSTESQRVLLHHFAGQVISSSLGVHVNLVPISPHLRQMHTFAQMPSQQSVGTSLST